jgi:hypothetical protein
MLRNGSGTGLTEGRQEGLSLYGFRARGSMSVSIGDQTSQSLGNTAASDAWLDIVQGGRARAIIIFGTSAVFLCSRNVPRYNLDAFGNSTGIYVPM